MKQILNHRFWTTQNVGLLVAALMPIPVIIGITTFLVRGSNQAATDPAPIEVVDNTPVVVPVPVVEPVAPEPQVDPFMLQAFLSRVEQAHEDSKIHGMAETFREELENAKSVELIDTSYFESGSRTLDGINQSALQNHIENHQAMREFGSDPKAIIVVLGYADLAGAETTNNWYALARAQSVEDSVNEVSSRPTHSWFIGETNGFGDEARVNRVAEAWLIVPRTDVFAGIGSDEIVTENYASHSTTKASTTKAYCPPVKAKPVKTKKSCSSNTSSVKSYLQSNQFRRLQMMRRRSCN